MSTTQCDLIPLYQLHPPKCSHTFLKKKNIIASCTKSFSDDLTELDELVSSFYAVKHIHARCKTISIMGHLMEKNTYW